MGHEHYVLVLVVAIGCGIVGAQNFENLDVLADICPPVGNHTEIVFLDSEECSPNADMDCGRDEECRIGSKCCLMDSCGRRCVELRTGRVTVPKLQAPGHGKTQRRRRQVVGCVACATCIRRCESDRDCRGGRRNRCYHNTCSSYCTV